MQKRKWLIDLRGKMLQKELAEKCGIEASTLCMIENGQRQLDISLSMLERIAEAFNMPISEIVELEKAYLKEKQGA